MFKKIFKTLAQKLQPKPLKATKTSPTPVVTEVKEPAPKKKGYKRPSGTNVQNYPGCKRKPPTMMASPDNQMTQLKDERIVPQKRSLRVAR